MAASVLTSWGGQHFFGTYRVVTNYHVYADMNDATATPFLYLQNCIIRTEENDVSQIQSRLPFTLQIQLDWAGTVYTFQSGTEIYHHEADTIDPATGTLLGAYYYVDVSSQRPVYIPKDAQEFQIVTTVTDALGQQVAYAENACGPMANSITGYPAIYTGVVAQYSLGRAVINSEKFRATANLRYLFPSMGANSISVDAYTGPYMPMQYKRESFTDFSFVATKGFATTGDVAEGTSGGFNYITFAYYYYTHDDYFGASQWPAGDGTYNTNAILISFVTYPVRITARDEVNDDIKPVLGSASHGYYGYDTHVAKYGAAVQGQIKYYLQLNYKTRDDNYEDDRTPFPPYYSRNLTLPYGALFSSVRVDDRSSGESVVNTYTGQSTYFNYGAVSLDAVVTDAPVNVALTTSFGQTVQYSDTVSVIAYSPPELTTASVRRCSVVSAETEGAYEYDGAYYLPDDYGEYCLIEWGTQITPLGDVNSKRLTIRDPYYIDQGGSSVRVITPENYTDSGYYVVAADGEKSYDIQFVVTDDFGRAQHTAALSTVLAIMDFLNVGSLLTDVRAFAAGTSTRHISNVVTYYRAIYNNSPGWDLANYSLVMPKMNATLRHLYVIRQYTITEGETVTTDKSSPFLAYTYDEKHLQPSSVQHFYRLGTKTQQHGDIAPAITDDGWVDAPEDIMITSNLSTTIFSYSKVYFGGSSGVAFGKVAELQQTFDVHRNWLLRMPVDVEIGNYGQNGESVHLGTWMNQTMQRIQNIIDARSVMIYKGGQFYDGNSAVCIPSGYGTVEISQQSYNLYAVCGANRVCAVKLSNSVNVSRQYLHFELGVTKSFAGQGNSTVALYPTIYVMGTEPTTIDQGTGIPSGTVLTSKALTGALLSVGSQTDGYQYHEISYSPGQGSANRDNYIDVSQFIGQNVWIIATLASGQSQYGTYTFTGDMNIRTIAFTNTAL